MQEKIEKALRAAGLEYKPVTIWNEKGEGRPGIMVYHNYTGPYPTAETWQQIYKVKRIANRHKMKHETRGYYTGTLIYKEEDKSA